MKGLSQGKYIDGETGSAGNFMGFVLRKGHSFTARVRGQHAGRHRHDPLSSLSDFLYQVTRPSGSLPPIYAQVVHTLFAGEPLSVSFLLLARA